jgi:hypothetical protein
MFRDSFSIILCSHCLQSILFDLANNLQLTFDGFGRQPFAEVLGSGGIINLTERLAKHCS